jgi:hypothetical protein
VVSYKSLEHLSVLWSLQAVDGGPGKFIKRLVGRRKNGEDWAVVITRATKKRVDVIKLS